MVHSHPSSHRLWSQRVVFSSCLTLIGSCLLPGSAEAQTQVRAHLAKLRSDASLVSFGLPIGFGVLTDSTKVQIINSVTGESIAGVNTKALLQFYDGNGKSTSIRALLIH